MLVETVEETRPEFSKDVPFGIVNALSMFQLTPEGTVQVLVATVQLPPLEVHRP